MLTLVVNVAYTACTCMRIILLCVYVFIYARVQAYASTF